MITRVQIWAWEVRCERPECQHRGIPWIFVGVDPPVICRYCRSREWNGKKSPQPKRAGVKLPKPKRVREIEEEF
ncbi:MAG TPA: hypothetical protein VFW94_23705 [Candidatus Acidoferrales bacterium]|nr:hypothetical protein [Candidatus Acidoferrales bacterium]